MGSSASAPAAHSRSPPRARSSRTPTSTPRPSSPNRCASPPVSASTPTTRSAWKSCETMTASLTPAQIVAELDRYIVGQRKAKRAVAIALRNRWRRQNLPPELRDEVAPKNIIMIGPTGVGKTEIARSEEHTSELQSRLHLVCRLL